MDDQVCKTENGIGQTGTTIKMEAVRPTATGETELDTEENSRRKSVDGVDESSLAVQDVED